MSQPPSESSPAKHVLVVEDEPMLRELEAEVLHRAGYDVEEAGDGAAAIRLLSTRCFDLVVLDLVMPGINGWDVLKHIQALSCPPPVVVASGSTEARTADPLSRQVLGYLLKPFRADDLLKMCEQVLAASAIAPATGSRREARRTYVVEATLLSPLGVPLVAGQLLQLSRGGLRLELSAPVEPGDPVFVSFRIPGRERPLELHGCVRWREAALMGVQVEGLLPSDERLLMGILDPDGTDASAAPPAC
jgi:CheY-like chemotaxis protein